MVRICVVRLRARLAKNLSVRRMDPYIIMERIEAIIFDLDIPASMGIHPIFIVEDLTPYYEPREYVDPSSGEAQPRTPPFPLPWHLHSPPTTGSHHNSPIYDPHLPGDLSSLVPPTTLPIAPGSTTRELSVESITKTRLCQYTHTIDDDDTWILLKEFPESRDPATVLTPWNPRKEYKQLDMLRNVLPNVPFMSLTATATAKFMFCSPKYVLTVLIVYNMDMERRLQFSNRSLSSLVFHPLILADSFCSLLADSAVSAPMVRPLSNRLVRGLLFALRATTTFVSTLGNFGTASKLTDPNYPDLSVSFIFLLRSQHKHHHFTDDHPARGSAAFGDLDANDALVRT
ncbi:hypothetical protein KSP39_PZI008815 [Platanthera zijinensis]|uniref:Tf2-1-like SH3-like domain-containing protein n=1 Tax=Platanthera zijinensis TaxID=2320716 RepID=A0AAP0BKB4_9ASPA